MYWRACVHVCNFSLYTKRSTVGEMAMQRCLTSAQSRKGQCHEIFCFWFSSWISFPPAPEYPIRTILYFFENSRRYSQVKVHHRYRRHLWKIFPPVLLVWCILSNEYLREFSKKFETALMVYWGAWGKLIHEKNQESKISRHCSFKGTGSRENNVFWKV